MLFKYIVGDAVQHGETKEIRLWVCLGAANVEHVRHVYQLQLRQIRFNFLHTLLIVLIVNSFDLNFAFDAILEFLYVTTQIVILSILVLVLRFFDTFGHDLIWILLLNLFNFGNDLIN